MVETTEAQATPVERRVRSLYKTYGKFPQRYSLQFTVYMTDGSYYDCGNNEAERVKRELQKAKRHSQIRTRSERSESPTLSDAG